MGLPTGWGFTEGRGFTDGRGLPRGWGFLEGGASQGRGLPRGRGFLEGRQKEEGPEVQGLESAGREARLGKAWVASPCPPLRPQEARVRTVSCHRVPCPSRNLSVSPGLRGAGSAPSPLLPGPSADAPRGSAVSVFIAGRPVPLHFRKGSRPSWGLQEPPHLSRSPGGRAASFLEPGGGAEPPPQRRALPLSTALPSPGCPLLRSPSLDANPKRLSQAPQGPEPCPSPSPRGRCIVLDLGSRRLGGQGSARRAGAACSPLVSGQRWHATSADTEARCSKEGAEAAGAWGDAAGTAGKGGSGRGCPRQGTCPRLGRG